MSSRSDPHDERVTREHTRDHNPEIDISDDRETIEKNLKDKMSRRLTLKKT